MSVPEQGFFTNQVEFITRHIFWDTPGILTGLVLFTPAPGDIYLPLGFISIATAWDGTTPAFAYFPQGEAVSGFFGGGDATQQDVVSAGGHGQTYAQKGIMDTIEALDTASLMIAIHDGAGGNPGPTTGEAYVTVAISRKINRPPF